VPIFGEYADVGLLAELAVEAADAGWDGFWVWDHLQWSGEDDGDFVEEVDPKVRAAKLTKVWRSCRDCGLGGPSTSRVSTTRYAGRSCCRRHDSCLCRSGWEGSGRTTVPPLRRAARFDGVHPLLFSVTPAERPAAGAERERIRRGPPVS
jgi:hypothetical protein